MGNEEINKNTDNTKPKKVFKRKKKDSENSLPNSEKNKSVDGQNIELSKSEDISKETTIGNEATTSNNSTPKTENSKAEDSSKLRQGRVGGRDMTSSDRKPGGYRITLRGQENNNSQGNSGGYQGGYQNRNNNSQGNSGGYQGGYQNRNNNYQGNNQNSNYNNRGYQGNNNNTGGGYQGGYQNRNNNYQGNNQNSNYNNRGYQGNNNNTGAGYQNRGLQGSGGFNNNNGQRFNHDSKKPVEVKKVVKKDYDKKEKKESEKEIFLKKQQASISSVPRQIVMGENITIADLAKKMNLKANQIIQALVLKGTMVTINQSIDSDTASIIAMEFNCEVKVESLFEQTQIVQKKDEELDLIYRAPVVTIMGHVDHGKTRLLDTIRKTNIIDTESGGITQHIGAYKVILQNDKSITFIDTPGHEAFAKMRSRGSKITDIVILVVSAVDGVMPQTLEAISHSKEADVPIVVAINKIDLPDANPEKIKTQLGEHGLVPEEWGGTTIYNEISAKQNIGIKELLESVLLQAEMLDLKANPNKQGNGKVIESRIEKGKGIVITTLLLEGSIKVGDSFVAGVEFGKIKAMFDDKGKKLEVAGPSDPVEIMGSDGVPLPGDPFNIVSSEKEAKELSDKRKSLKKLELHKNVKKVNLSNLFESIKDGEVKELKLIIKADVQGSIEAIISEVKKMDTAEVRVNVIHSGIGEITESDVMLAATSSAIVIGFKVRPNANALSVSQEEKVDIRKYNIIYEIADDIKEALSGLLSPEIREISLGKVIIRKIFKSTKIGNIAGCSVDEGKVKRDSFVNMIRNNIVIGHDIKILSLQREKNSVAEVLAGFECGIVLDNMGDIQEDDILEVYEYKEFSKKL